MTAKFELTNLNEDDISLSGDEETAGDDRVSIDVPVPGKGRFVKRVDEPVTLLLSELTDKFPPRTIPSFFANACRRYKNRMAFNSLSYTTVRTTTFEEYYNKALDIAKGLLAVSLHHAENL
ncbi:hypothetical protein ElyMa_002148300 [Elysia marginata]|uniref:Uncharacterized protein n=1 Tax=Elysia marginata TaxID=1093978 RepID=A0AAV4FLS1_9GAST|nr:hypothetical protein ElyMa_002148300 [Elysia marginata]